MLECKLALVFGGRAREDRAMAGRVQRVSPPQLARKSDPAAVRGAVRRKLRRPGSLAYGWSTFWVGPTGERSNSESAKEHGGRSLNGASDDIFRGHNGYVH